MNRLQNQAFRKSGFAQRFPSATAIAAAFLLGAACPAAFAHQVHPTVAPPAAASVHSSELGDPAVVPGFKGTTQVWGTADYYLIYNRLDEHHVGHAREQPIEIRRVDGSKVKSSGGRFWDLTPHDFVIRGKKVRLIIAGGTLTDDFDLGNPGRRLRVLISKGIRRGVERFQVLDGPIIGNDSSGWDDHMYGHVLRTHSDGSLWIAHEKRYEKDGHAVTEIWEDKIKLAPRFDGKHNPIQVTGESRRLLETPLNSDTVRDGGRDYQLEGLREVTLRMPSQVNGRSQTETVGFVAAKDYPTDNYPLYVSETDPDPHATSVLRLARDGTGKLIDLSVVIRDQVKAETGIDLSWGPSRGEPKQIAGPNSGKARILLYFHGLKINEIIDAGIPWNPSVWPEGDHADFNRGIYSIEFDVSRDPTRHLKFELVPHTFRTIRPSWINMERHFPKAEIVRCLQETAN